MSLTLIANVPAGTTPTSGDVSAPADTAIAPALAEIANTVFADVLRVIHQTLDAAPADPAVAAAADEGDASDDDTDTTTGADLGSAAAMLPAMAMTLVPAALQAAGISFAATAQTHTPKAIRDVALGEVGTARAERPLAALPEAATAPAAAARSTLPDASVSDVPVPSTASRVVAPAAIDTAAARAPVERQPLPVPSDASAVSAMAPVLPADRDAAASDAVLKLNAAAPSQWRQPLQDALGDRLQLQLGRGSDHALIRLDPPTLGRIEIMVRHENGNLQVHLSASNPEVLRQLNHIGDSLRQDLVARQHGEVSVTVTDTGRDAAGRERSRDQAQPDDPTPHRALAEADEAAVDATPFTLAHARD